MSRTAFQQEFRLSNEPGSVYYTAEQIKDAIEQHFPFEDGSYKGLARILVEQAGINHADEELDLTALIPDITDDTEISELLNFIGIVEGVPRAQQPPTASTYFKPTELGYECERME